MKVQQRNFSQRTQWSLSENRIARTLSELQAAGTAIIDLTVSNPTECSFHYPHDRILDAFARPNIFRYQPDPRGLAETREAVAAYYQSISTTISALDLILTSGTSEAYSHVFRLLCNPGDEVLIASPGYPLFDFLADLCDVKLVRYPLVYDHGWQIDFSALSAATGPRTRAVIVVHPNNPTGHFSSQPEQAQLQQFCAERGLALIADEVFLDFALDGQRRKSFARNKRALTFTLSGLSKMCGLPQMKLAWIAVSGPEAAKQGALERLEVISDAYLSVGTPVQVAAASLLETRAAFQAQASERVAANLRELDRQLSSLTICSRLACEGGWSAVLRVPATQSDEDLAVALLQGKQVAVHPGHFYDFAQPGHIVISLIVPAPEFCAGIERVLDYFR